MQNTTVTRSNRKDVISQLRAAGHDLSENASRKEVREFLASNPVKLDQALALLTPAGQSAHDDFAVGDGAHTCFNGDSYPVTVRKVTRCYVWVSRDTDYKCDESVAYSESRTTVTLTGPNPDPGPDGWEKFRRSEDGHYSAAGGYPSLGKGRCYSQNPHI